MSADRSLTALPPIGRRPVGAVEESPRLASTPAAASPPPANGPTRLLVGAHLLLLIQSALILFSGIDLGPARAGIALVSIVSTIAFAWAVIERVRQPSYPIRRRHHDA